MLTITWPRVLKALSQVVRQYGVSPELFRTVQDRLPKLLEVCGPASQTNRVAIRIGETLLRGDHRIVVPTCPDYSHERGRYNFQCVRGGMSLLLRRHIPFIERVVEVLPDAKILIMIADQEANDEALCRATHVGRETFLVNVRRSVISTKLAFASRGLPWEVALMTEVIPNLTTREEQLAEWIAQEERFARHITSDTYARRGMYTRMRLRGSQLRTTRTIQTAAQYVALGKVAEENGWLIVNHTTTNLAWYLKTRVGFLHNPVRVY
ncbi:MAG: hypothetical protein NUV84_04850 [Candidatus Uhrbacteria bacterium]|nr:hypothetical protein [Candidatus Uhrbacteria bacterium]